MQYMPLAPSRRVRRASWWGAGVLAVCALAAPTFAEQASSSFAVTINVVPVPEGTCTASAGGVSCQSTVVGGATSGRAPGDRDRLTYAAGGYRTRETQLKLAGELIEIGNENHYAWSESNYLAWGETSTRVVVAGGREYVEMTVAW